MSTFTRSYRWARNMYLIRKRGSNFFGSQWSGGVALVIFTVVALFLANWGVTKDAYHHILGLDLGIHLGNFRLSLTIEQWVNDALMAIFFFVVGLEIKRELMVGQLSDIKQAALPIAAAVGGMVVPALIYYSLNAGTQFEPGWGIPMATDIAFAIGVLSLLGDKVPVSLKIFLTALAIVDDLGAILVIAIFYTSTINFVMLGIGIALLCVLYTMNRQGLTSILLYLIPGVIIWYMFLNSGVHATISGVLIAMAMPTHPRFTKKYFIYKSRYFLEEFRFYDRPDREVIANEDQINALYKMHFVANSTISPAQRLEHLLSPIVTFLIMPVFALVNAGVEFRSLHDLMIFENTQTLGIFLGLVVGKPIGIFLLCWITIKLGLAVMPKGAGWDTMFGVACLGGIGFTMSIFIDSLAFSGSQELIDAGKIAVLIASVTAAIVGSLLLTMLARRNKFGRKEAKDGKKSLRA